jgi:hypothetical protein
MQRRETACSKQQQPINHAFLPKICDCGHMHYIAASALTLQHCCPWGGFPELNVHISLRLKQHGCNTWVHPPFCPGVNLWEILNKNFSIHNKIFRAWSIKERMGMGNKFITLVMWNNGCDPANLSNLAIECKSFRVHCPEHSYIIRLIECSGKLTLSCILI